jgi:phosphoglycerate dehydrogenase-like enzyme
MRFPSPENDGRDDRPNGGPGRPRLAAAFAMRPELPPRLFGPAELARIRALADIDESAPVTDFGRADPGRLARLDVLITGWGSPRIGARELGAMPRLRAIVHAGGSVKGHVSRDAWDRGLLVTTAADANALPVAEYTLAAILLAGKGVPALAAAYARDPAATGADCLEIGNYRRTVGIIAASRVGRRVIALLGPFDFRVLLYDPHLPPGDPVLRQAERVGLDDLFRRSSIVSVHAPLLPETAGLVGRDQIALMRPGSVIINTARAPILDQDALTEAVRAGRVRAVLDVTGPEPLPAGHPLRDLPGVILTPHVAGALGNELRRLGESATREIELFAAGHPAEHAVSADALNAMA